MSEPTGQHTLVLVLKHHGSRSCDLHGYPTVTLFDRSGSLPFRISHSGDQVVTAAKPGNATVAPQGRAYVALNKYRCDAGDRRRATQARLAFPGRHGSLSLRIGSAYDLSYCGERDPGSILTISPFEPTAAAAFQHG